MSFMRNWLGRFMTGRYGSDSLSKLLSVLACMLLILSWLLDGTASTLIFSAAFLFVAYSYFRVFSRSIAKRRQENERYLNIKNVVTGAFRGRIEKQKMRKTYHFYKCPSCKTELRVPKGKGRVRITCRKCGQVFTRKT